VYGGYKIKNMYIDKIAEKHKAVVAGDTEFDVKLFLPSNYSNFKEYKKVICNTEFVLVTLRKHDGNTAIYEHPDIKAGLLPSWNGNCVLVDYLGLKSVKKPKNTKVPIYPIAYLFYFSAFDIFGLFRDKQSQINIAKQLLGGRIIRSTSFPNCVRTGDYVEILNEKGIPIVVELGINPMDAKGYTPSGCRGLEGTFDTWGVHFENKNWKKFFDITNFSKEYKNTIDLVNVAPEGEEPHYMSKHEITVKYAREDGLKELFTLYENIHNSMQSTAERLKLNYRVRNFQTIGNAANQIGIGAISKGMGLDMENEEERFELAEYLYPSGGYALLDGYKYSVGFLLNIDGGYCKNLKPCHPRIRDLVLDMDLRSAYVCSMKSLPYCLGIPSVYSFPKGREFRPLFFTEYQKLSKKKMLCPGAWVGRVSTTTKLSFKQDLIFSKIFGETDFEKAQIEDEEGFFVIDDDNTIADLNEKGILAHIPDGSFQMLNNEIIGGILTHDILQVIQKYWTKAEQKELWEKLQIDAFIFYDARYELDAETFKIEFDKLDDEIHHSFENGCQNVSDKRKSIWTKIDTNDGWFGTLGDIRDEIKLEAVQALKDKDFLKAIELKASQNGVKNVNNSSFGVSGSPFYQTEKPKEIEKKNGEIGYYAVPKMGNPLFTQNLTARVRTAAWCMAKSLNGYPVVTDGTPFNINEVWSWNWKGINRSTFGSDYLWRLSRYNNAPNVDIRGMFGVKLAPLGGKKWVVTNLNPKKEEVTISNGEIEITGKEENWQTIDDMAYEHAKSLFGELDIFKNDVVRYASKDLYKGAAFQSQANYLFERFFDSRKDLKKNNTVFANKARGYNLSKLVHILPDLSDIGEIHPYEKMLNNIYHDDTADVYIENVFSPELLGIADFNKSEKVTNDYIERGFLPHSSTFRSSKPSPFSLSMFRWNTRKQYTDWDKKVEKWKSKTGFAVELLFLTKEMVETKTPLFYSQTVDKIQRMIDSDFKMSDLDKLVSDKLESIRHPQLIKEESFVNSEED
jgi:hypothetical protein